jgi:tetratricopeptide (TPR) repeat protein
VAKINVVKLKQDAAKETKAGRYEKAVELYTKIVQENPRDWNTLNQIGFCHEKLNDFKKANEQYQKVAQFYAKDGFYLKAIACWKKVLKNEPALLEAHLNLGDLYARQGLAAEAKGSLGVAYQECVNRNRLREAGQVLRRLAELDPSDMKVRVKLAELYAREGRQDKASEEYLTLADELVKKGHRQEALQLLEKGLKSGKRSPKLLAEVARVHLVQKDYKSALPYLEEARKGAPNDRDVALRMAEAYVGVERPGDARGILENLLGQDPQDLEAKQLLGQVFLSAGQPEEALEQILPMVDRLVARRELERAVTLLQPISQRDPPHIPALGKLVELYRLSRNEAMVIQTYSQMVEAYLTREEMGQAASVLEMLVQLEPHNEQHRNKLEWIQGQGVVAAPAASLPGGAGAGPGVAAASPVAAAAPAAADGGIALSGPLSPEDQEFVDEHLSEGRVFRKYGLTDKARDQFQAALNRFPDNLDARRELVDLHKDRGEGDEAATHLQALAQVLRLTGDEAGASQAEASAAELAPGGAAPPAAPAASAAPGALAPEPAIAAPPPPVPEAPAPVVEEELDIPLEVEGPPVEEEPDLQLLELTEESEEATAAPEEPAPPIFDEQELGGELQSDFIDVDEPPAAPAPAPALPDVSADVFDLGDAEAPPAELPGLDPAAELVPQAALSAEPVSGVPEDLQRVLGDVEQYVSLGFVEDAKEALGELGGRYADHPALLGKLAELGLEAPAAGPPPMAPDAFPADLGADLGSPLGDLAAPPPPEPPPPPPEEPTAGEEEPLQLDDLEFTPAPAVATDTAAEVAPPVAAGPGPDGSGEGFDLANELGGLFGAQPAVATETPAEGGGELGEGALTDLGDEALTDLFREFQKGVDKQLGKEDYETRYNLGIAYKEMGLVDEAVAEFQLAAKDEDRLLECASMLGICFIEKGMPKLAVKWFEKGLQAQGRSEQEYLGLRYDLANALEAAGDPARALEIYTELYGQDAGFRDVANKVRQLGASA